VLGIVETSQVSNARPGAPSFSTYRTGATRHLGWHTPGLHHAQPAVSLFAENYPPQAHNHRMSSPIARRSTAQLSGICPIRTLRHPPPPSFIFFKPWNLADNY
jgi:hypothetical protein